MRTLKVVGLGVSIVVFMVFVIQNLAALSHAEPLRLNLFLFSAASPPLALSILLVGAFGMGFGLAYALGFLDRRRLKKSIKLRDVLQRRLEAELKELRNLPITGEPSGPAGGKTPMGSS
jgi:hypothetical protein